ncbi:hypothetical protein [Streptomyces sp. NPDC048496]|uniref:hypothetical protein n=1 Tax=Streptomyces sp. NPDC048496 TaxID=3365558 RepID=UPI003718F73B
MSASGATVRIDDINRDPGLARGCARDAEDVAVTGRSGLYTDPDEIVLFTDDYAFPVPKPGIEPNITADDDPGFEVVLDTNGVVTVDVLNLDGGGSTTLLTGTEVQTPPTDAGKNPDGPKYVHRRVADAVYTGVGRYGMYAK